MIRLTRRAAIAGATLAPFAVARAQGNWPDKPVRLVVPFTPGGSTDILARAMGQRLGEIFNQPFIVDNRPGAGGTVGSEQVYRAAPDGLTLMMGHIGTLACNPALYPNLTFDTARFVPVALVANVANFLVVTNGLAARDVQALIALAKSKPGELTYGSGGNGSAAHIAMVAFNEATGTEMTHVPYRGTGPMLTDLIGGTIQLTMTGGPPALPPVRAGQLRALGISSLERLPSANDIPTVASQGVQGFEALQWYGIVAPPGTPPAIVARLNEACNRTLGEAPFRARLESEGAVADPMTPAQFGDYIARERDRWGTLIRRNNVSLG
ncbi:tripartite tricarboxylate transporter substrate binding protein [Roseomonas terrae]|uniref:Tripartite tricarboxylate transporter substrate binding protein n=1 Tax=Neoroseomonas terrae TaxID=424799 RepID=A0ABS5EEG9_9PROT|nr:tripartite tricarboxylate transporter substrate binding protein [Neoroseomonas terrae]MBR0649420.1 tripartite tricarboxylate transporter substrate binding protein [Neoroseomonas terrae]